MRDEKPRDKLKYIEERLEELERQLGWWNSEHLGSVSANLGKLKKKLKKLKKKARK